MTPEAETPLDRAADVPWDALVIGAGPAGATAARELARRGASVLLVDRSDFPRPKVCGCCLNPRAVAALRRAGLEALLAANDAVPLRRLVLACAGRRAEIALPGGAALSRAALDAALVDAAVRSNVCFLPRAVAQVGPADSAARQVTLRRAGRTLTIRARVVIGAAGLARAALRDAGVAVRPAPDARVGLGAVLDNPPPRYERGTIYMHCGGGGYVGLVRIERGRLNVAAALDPRFLRASGGPGQAVARTLCEAGAAPLPMLASLAWTGTGPLTQRVPRVAAERLLLIGDAAGYIEPFTGEGIAWALDSGTAVAPIAWRAARGWHPGLEADWARRHRQVVTDRQWLCRTLTHVLRRPVATAVLCRVLAALPALADPFVTSLNRSPGRVLGAPPDWSPSVPSPAPRPDPRSTAPLPRGLRRATTAPRETDSVDFSRVVEQ